MPAPDIAIFVDFIIWTYHFSKVSVTQKTQNRKPQKKSGSQRPRFQNFHLACANVGLTSDKSQPW
jgi:hypothetical protein